MQTMTIVKENLEAEPVEQRCTFGRVLEKIALSQLSKRINASPNIVHHYNRPTEYFTPRRLQ